MASYFYNTGHSKKTKLLFSRRKVQEPSLPLRAQVDQPQPGHGRVHLPDVSHFSDRATSTVMMITSLIITAVPVVHYFNIVSAAS